VRNFAEIVGRSAGLAEVIKQVEVVAPTELIVSVFQFFDLRVLFASFTVAFQSA
jgi:hypothetical protein